MGKCVEDFPITYSLRELPPIGPFAEGTISLLQLLLQAIVWVSKIWGLLEVPT